MEKLIQFLADNGETYGVNLSMVITTLTPEEMEDLGNQGEEAMHVFFAEEFDQLFDRASSCGR